MTSFNKILDQAKEIEAKTGTMPPRNVPTAGTN